jgi:hypothetical protein
LKTVLPPQALQALDSNEPMPPAAMMKLQQAAQQVQMVTEKAQELAQENQQLKAGVQAKQLQTQADHDAKMKELALQAQADAESARLAREKAERELLLKAQIAERELQIKEDMERRKAISDVKMLVSEALIKIEATKKAQQAEQENDDGAEEASIEREETKILQGLANAIQILTQTVTAPRVTELVTGPDGMPTSAISRISAN